VALTAFGTYFVAAAIWRLAKSLLAGA
jgi:hypothetical protein